MSNSIKIAIDVMGSDKGPEAIISGAALSKERNPSSEFIFFGEYELLSKLESLKQSGHLELERETIKNLKTVLQTADLVKFARSTPEFGSTSKDRELVEGVVIETKEALPEPTPEEIREREEYRLLSAKKRRKKQLQWGFASVGILLILSLSVAISVYGFYPVRDTLVGYPSIKLKNKEQK